MRVPGALVVVLLEVEILRRTLCRSGANLPMFIQRFTAGRQRRCVSCLGFSASLNTLLSTPRLETAIDGVKRSAPSTEAGGLAGIGIVLRARAEATAPPRHTSAKRDYA